MICEYNCEQCGRHVRKRRSPANTHSPPRFCSQACHGAARRGTGTGPSLNHAFTCENCGAECNAYRSPSAPEPRFCSVQCTGAAQAGAANPAFVSGRHIDANGYMRVRVDGRYEFEHRLVMERSIGRPLTRIEVVHHINQDRADNRIENLYLCANQAEHRAIHAAVKAP